MEKYVHIVHRNEQMLPVYDEMIELSDYSDLLRNDLIKLIGTIEDMVGDLTGTPEKGEWPDETWGAFTRIKHRLLDCAGAIKRLPENLVIGGEQDGKHPDGAKSGQD